MQRILLVGLEYHGEKIEGTVIETRGLCRRDTFQLHAAAPLYDYDVIVIYPRSYSHFTLGKPGEFSESPNELFDLKKKDNGLDLDSLFDRWERSAELSAAIKGGTRVIWLATADKPIKFYGWRSLYSGYSHKQPEELLKSSTVYEKSSNKVRTNSDELYFADYFRQLEIDGWSLCWCHSKDENCVPLAWTPEGYFIGEQLIIDGRVGWLLTPPSTEKALETLVRSVLNIGGVAELQGMRYHDIFLSHGHEDKPFVKMLQDAFVERGVKKVWVDEAEILVGDSLLKKIAEGIEKTEYFGIVLSPNSVDSPWVQHELEQAMNYEINAKSVKVLPLLHKDCDIPPFLKGKLYADFSGADKFQDSLNKLLRRLERKNSG